jgi:ATP adenylyltransferase/5',5'''-P-1,P-4-tetraphosphate phosphorylase II
VDDISSRYQRALQRTRDVLKEPGKAVAHNVVMVKEWIIVIPRTSKGVDGCGANGLGMMGMVWVKDQEERDCWTKFGPSKYLIQLGIPNDELKEDVSSSNFQEG